MHNTSKGIPVPDAGDDLLRAYEAGFNAAGIVVPFASIAAFRAALAAAEAAGAPATAAHPWYGDVGGVLYRANGSKGGNAVYDLEAVNGVKHHVFPCLADISGVHTLNEGQWKRVVQANLDTKPYDRWFFASGSVWTRVQQGGCDIELYRSRSDNSTAAKSGVNHSDDGTTIVTMAGLIPAGGPGDMALYVYARKRADSAAVLKVQLSRDTWTRLDVIVGPASMV